MLEAAAARLAPEGLPVMALLADGAVPGLREADAVEACPGGLGGFALPDRVGPSLMVQSVTWSADPARGLYEREAELARVQDLVGEVRGGAGRVLLVEGAPGIGKSRILAAAAARARAAGMTVLRAEAGEQERDFAFGVVRRLFEPWLADAGGEARARALLGAAALAAPVVDPRHPAEHVPSPRDRNAAVLHGLYWLVANMAAERPLLVAVDDLQWADAASAQWLAYLARRLDELPVLLAVTARAGETVPDALETSETRLLTLAPLSDAGAACVVRDALGAEVDPALARACHAATAGNPFFLHELVADLADLDVAGRMEGAVRVDDVTPRRVSRNVVERLGRLGPECAALARAVAVFDTRAELRHAAAVAGLDASSAATAADALARAGLVTVRPLRFVHPIVRAAVYGDIPAATRALQHARAARVLAAERADPIHVATHLMAAEPAGEEDVVERLREAAAAAAAAGAPAAASAYLRRALAEPPAAERQGELLGELGQAEMMARDPAAEAHLREAMRRAGDPVARGRAALALAEVVGFAGRLAEARAITTAAIEELGPDEIGLVVALEAQRARNDAIDRRYAAELDRRTDHLLGLAEAAGPPGRELLLSVAFRVGLRGARSEQVVALVERGLDNGRFIAEEGADTPAAVVALSALFYADEPDRAAAVLDDVARDARARGAILAHVAVGSFGAWIAGRQGDLRTAEAVGQTTLELADEHGQHFPAAFTRAFRVHTLAEMGRFAEADEAAAAVPLDDLRQTSVEATLLESRARLRIGQGRRGEAMADLRASGEVCVALGIDNPALFPWRSLLALALPRVAREEAVELVGAELAQAERLGQPRGIGSALAAGALLCDGDERVEGLRLAVAALEGSPATLELARALVDLGVAQRHLGRRVDAREPLLRGLELADRCGAEPLAERARAELHIAGARPRRAPLTGEQALTPNEQRVAAMAREGLSNPEIAQALFVSRKTVEKHLSAAYRKLGIATRAELRVAGDR